ncbi:MAG: carbohydrate-binding family 9-like protein [Verrucomicrobiota bacterium]
MNKEPHWPSVSPLTDFAFPWSSKPTPETIFRAAVSHDDKFHFRFEIEDKDIVLGHGRTVTEKVLSSDRGELFFAADPCLTDYFCLEIDPRGYVFECHMRYYRNKADTWSWPGLEVTAQVHPGRYEITGRFPIQSLRDLDILKSTSPTMIAGVYRAEFSRATDGSTIEDWISWVDPQTKNPDFHIPASFGAFELI